MHTKRGMNYFSIYRIKKYTLKLLTYQNTGILTKYGLFKSYFIAKITKKTTGY